jgi:hypothetical protein
MAEPVADEGICNHAAAKLRSYPENNQEKRKPCKVTGKTHGAGGKAASHGAKRHQCPEGKTRGDCGSNGH